MVSRYDGAGKPALMVDMRAFDFFFFLHKFNFALGLLCSSRVHLEAERNHWGLVI